MAVLEIVRFRTKTDTDEQAFQDLNERFQREVVPSLPGLERREATRSEDGEWVLVLRYQDMESATAGPRRDAGDAVAGAFMSMIEPSSMSVSRHPVISD